MTNLPAQDEQIRPGAVVYLAIALLILMAIAAYGGQYRGWF